MTIADPAEPERVEPFRIRSLWLAVYLPTLLFSVGQGAIVPIVPLVATDDLGASIAVAGVIVALRGIGAIVFDVPAGLLVARFGERRAVMFSTFALAVISTTAALTSTLWLYALAVFALGGASAVWQLARLTFVSAHAPPEVRGRALSLLGGIARVGQFLGPILGGIAGVVLGLQSGFFIQAALASIGAIVLMWFVRDEDDAVEEKRQHSALREVSNVLSHHRGVFLTAGVVAMCVSMLRSARQAVLPLWGDYIGLDAAEIGALFSISSAIDMLTFYPVGILMDRYGRKFAAIPSLVLMGTAMVLIPLAHGFGSLLLVGLMLGLGNGFGAGIVQTLGADFAPPKGRSEFLGVWRLIADTGQAIGPTVIGGLSAVATLGVGSVVTGGIGIAAAALMGFVVPGTMHRHTRRGGHTEAAILTSTDGEHP